EETVVAIRGLLRVDDFWPSRPTTECSHCVRLAGEDSEPEGTTQRITPSAVARFRRAYRFLAYNRASKSARPGGFFRQSNQGLDQRRCPPPAGVGGPEKIARSLHRLVEREEADLAVGHLRAQLCARLTEECTGAGDVTRRKDCLVQVAQVRRMLDERLGVPVPLEDDALGLIVGEVNVVLQ